MANVSVPIAVANQILKKTMRTLGYGRELAELAVWSALWLESRGGHGVQKLIVYMMLIQDMRLDDLRPRKDGKYGTSGVCPFMLAGLVASQEEALMKRGEMTLGAPASPDLFAPAIADLVSRSGRSLRIRHREYSCLYSDGGIAFESESFGTWSLVSPDEKGPMLLELSDLKPSGLRKLDSIDLPKIRLGASGVLNLRSGKD